MGICANKQSKRDVPPTGSKPQLKKQNTSHSQMSTVPELFQDMPEWDGERYKGEGIKRMKGYKCDIPINELYKIREDFWITKFKTGLIWKSLRQACTMDDVRACNIIHSLGLRTVSGCLNELADGKGNYYRIPNFCINDPYFEKIISNEDTYYNYDRVSNLIKFYVYDLYNNKKIMLETMDNITGKELKDLYCKKADINFNGKSYKIKLFFGGAEILNEHMLFKHNVKNDYTVQIMIFPENGE